MVELEKAVRQVLQNNKYQLCSECGIPARKIVEKEMHGDSTMGKQCKYGEFVWHAAWMGLKIDEFQKEFEEKFGFDKLKLTNAELAVWSARIEDEHKLPNFLLAFTWIGRQRGLL